MRALLLALTAFAASGCQSSKDEAADCAAAISRVSQLRLEARNPTMSRENARRHARQIALAANRPLIERCEGRGRRVQSLLSACVNEAADSSEAERCLRRLKDG